MSDDTAYRRYAEWVCQGAEAWNAARTNLNNHWQSMDCPRCGRGGLTLSSGLIASTVKPINPLRKGTEKFLRNDTGDALLRLCAD